MPHKKHWVVIFVDDEGKYRVTPGCLVAEEDHTVRFFNCTDDKAEVTFLEKTIIFDENGKEVKEFSLEKKGELRDAAGIQPGWYPYNVVFKDKNGTKHEAQASRPIIIGYP